MTTKRVGTTLGGYPMFEKVLPCKCGHPKADHDRQKKAGWCSGEFRGSPCDCDGYEAEQGQLKGDPPMSRPPNLKQAVCPKCGESSFDVPYTEQAWERWYGAPKTEASSANSAIQFHEDGHDIDEHCSDLKRALCRGCGKSVDLSGLEQVP